AAPVDLAPPLAGQDPFGAVEPDFDVVGAELVEAGDVVDRDGGRDVDLVALADRGEVGVQQLLGAFRAEAGGKLGGEVVVPGADDAGDFGFELVLVHSGEFGAPPRADHDVQA